MRSRMEALSSTSTCIYSRADVLSTVSLNSSVFVVFKDLSVAAESVLYIPYPLLSPKSRSVPLDTFLINFAVSVKYCWRCVKYT